jgi:energy-coupling factor transporter ATP-binding protein EcfA2
MGVVMDISDRVVVLDYGRKIADGSSPGVVAAYLGEQAHLLAGPHPTPGTPALAGGRPGAPPLAGEGMGGG